MELKDALHRTIGEGASCMHACSRVLNYNTCLISKRLWVFSYAYLINQNVSLDHFFVPAMPEPYREYCNKGAGCWQCNKYRAYSFNEEFAKEKEKVVKGPIGLCLDCVSTKRESFRTGECRIKHDFERASEPRQEHWIMLKIIMAKEYKGGKEPNERKKDVGGKGMRGFSKKDFYILKFPAVLRYTMYVSLSQNNAKHSALLQRQHTGAHYQFHTQTSRILS